MWPAEAASAGSGPASSGSVAEELQQQRGDLLRLLLLNPVARPVDQVNAGHPGARPGAHRVQGTGRLVVAPVLLARDERGRDVDGAAAQICISASKAPEDPTR